MKREETRQTGVNEKVKILKGTLLIIAALAVVLLGLNYSGKAEAAGNGDTLAQAPFELVIGGVSAGYFTECTGIGSKNEIVDHKVIGPNGQPIIIKIPGRLTWNNIVLKRGISSNTEMWTWRKQVEDGDIVNARKDITIVLYDQSMQPVASWNLINAWLPVINTSFAANGSLQEDLTLVCEGEERIN